ncbi:dipicolinate synthase subunit DpsA [Calderihabitans maritimus]|uniref:Dipicolinic acid synthetase, A subunit n=1 Tax=Calderihabitans maritimus TaxID=1246530 RepID=A0A1Z5HQI3_9FIRM|nr:dipicolinate synthase subunit DpsA [Calderihabitans maritimus]GAW91774.1 dipicolinic acid synthetase, A subunit [Calderihabitans maritimus]
MPGDLTGIKVAVIGGDRRELFLIEELLSRGAQVKVVGLPPHEMLKGVKVVDTIKHCVSGADVIILPMPGTDEKGNVRAPYAEKPLFLTEEIVKDIPRNVPIFIGVAKPFLKFWAQKYELRLVEVAEKDEVAIWNSIPSAEGAIQIAMEQLPITIHNSRSYVLGFGRVGITLARMLHGIGAKVTVVARKEADLARCFELGYSTCDFYQLPSRIKEADVVFNTVPALVLTEEILVNVSPETLIIDLASSPGGTDFRAAEKLGIKAILAPGLPGKVAPKTAGRILAQVIPRLISQELELTARRCLA